MENKKYIVGNMKMNLNFEEIEVYFNQMKEIAKNEQVIFCPTDLYVPYFIEQGYHTGVQTTSEYAKGAYTGELSAVQAASIGCTHTILGHSERRVMFHETDDIVARKVRQALNFDLSVILCVGESEEERKNGTMEAVLKRELEAVFVTLTEEEAKKVMIAYEPIWAIGTGSVPTNEEIKYAIDTIQTILKSFGITESTILYGGSVNDSNISELNQIDNVSGFLVGGACLNAVKFLSMIEVVLK